MNGSQARRNALNLFLASIGINAALGIWALVADDFGSTQGKILATSFLVSAAMLSVLVNGPALEQREVWPLPLASAGAAVAGFGFFIVMVWTEFDEEWFIKTTMSCMIFAAGGTLLVLLESVSLRRQLHLVRWFYRSLISLLCLTSVVAIWAEIDSDWIPRVIGVESILVAASTLATPALSRFLPKVEPVDRPAGGIRFCPSCGADVAVRPLTGSTLVSCGSCGLSVRIESAAGRLDQPPRRTPTGGRA